MRSIKIVQDQMDLFQGGCCSGPFLLNSSDRPQGAQPALLCAYFSCIARDFSDFVEAFN